MLLLTTLYHTILETDSQVWKTFGNLSRWSGHGSFRKLGGVLFWGPYKGYHYFAFILSAPDFGKLPHGPQGLPDHYFGVDVFTILGGYGT